MQDFSSWNHISLWRTVGLSAPPLSWASPCLPPASPGIFQWKLLENHLETGRTFAEPTILLLTHFETSALKGNFLKFDSVGVWDRCGPRYSSTPECGATVWNESQTHSVLKCLHVLMSYFLVLVFLFDQDRERKLTLLCLESNQLNVNEKKLISDLKKTWNSFKQKKRWKTMFICSSCWALSLQHIRGGMTPAPPTADAVLE